jgi:hypothetical protein
MLDSAEHLGLSLLATALAAFVAAPSQAQTPTTTIQNGNADTRLQLNYDGGLLVPGIFGSTTPADSIPASDAGTRLMWYPAKAAFRAGRVGDRADGTQWNAGKVGNYSVAFGVDSKAQGRASVAIGDLTEANGQNSVALGSGADATGRGSVSLGRVTVAEGDFSVALGRRTDATAQSSVALGSYSSASASAAVALGGTASGIGATSMNRALASGRNAVAMGQNTTASAERSVSMGRYTTAANPQSLSTGVCNSANTSLDNTLFVVGNGTFDSNNFNCSSRDDAFTIDESGNATASSHDTFSDRRLKTGVEPLGEGVLEALRDIDPVRYQFKDQSTHPSGEQVGLIAQDVREEFPSLVSKGAGGYLSLAYPKMTAVLLKGIQEQQAQLEKKQAQIDSLKEKVRQIQDVKKRLAALEADRSPSVVAGWAGSGAGLLLAFLLGGLLGAGLLWRRRG